MFAGGGYDRVGVFDVCWSEVPKLWVQQGLPTQPVIENGREVTKPVDLGAHLGFDLQFAGGWLDPKPIRGFEEVLEEADEWIVKRNGAGAAFKFWKHKSGTPEHIDFQMSSREIWEQRYRPHLLEVDRERFKLDEDRANYARWRAAGKWTYFGHWYIWELARASLGDLNFYQSLILDPGWIHDFNRVYTDFIRAHYQLLFSEVGLPDGIWIPEDLGFKGRLFASPATLKSLFFPYYAEIVQWYHDRGLPVVMHSCGNITEALPLIVEAGFDALNPMEVKAGCDIFDMARRYGNRLVFVGGFDVRILETNDRDTIQGEVGQWIDRLKALGARFLFGSDHSITPRVNYDSYRWALDAYREHMWF
jgi:uroporphyrinogen decarboxylase